MTKLIKMYLVLFFLITSFFFTNASASSEKIGTVNKKNKMNFEQSIIISKESFESKKPYDIIYSNVSFINALLRNHFKFEELSQNALRSYYVDYYLAQVNNGGFSQFVYNSRANKEVFQYVQEGLQSMGAQQHYKLFNQSLEILNSMNSDEIKKFFHSNYFGKNKERDLLNKFNNSFFELLKYEDLIKLNANWLRSFPDLQVMTIEKMKTEIKRRTTKLSDYEARVAKALKNEPRYMKQIRALCEKAKHKLSRVTAGDLTHKHNGKTILAWHFITDKGHHYMIEVGGKVIMFNGSSYKKIVEIKASL